MSSVEKLDKWVKAVCEPSHNINLADHDIREMQIFSWLVRITNTVGSISSSLNIGKELEQMLESADDLNQTAQGNLSDIRNTLFVSTLCGVVDFYSAVAKLSCKVEKVDVMPWEITQSLENGITNLSRNQN